MKRNLLYLGLTGYLLFAPRTRLQAQTGSLRTRRYVTRATMHGVGFINVFDIHPSPQEYKGIDFRISHETIRMTKLFDGNVSMQNFFQTDVGYTHNRTDSNNIFSGFVNWSYGLHYQFRLTKNFKLPAGGLFDANGRFVHNLRNPNNPASARAYVNLDASGMAIQHLKIKRYPMVFRYQVNVPMIGLMLLPHYGQSYYEIFSLGSPGGVIQSTFLHNQPPPRQMPSTDLSIGYTKIRLSYLADLRQSNVNEIKIRTHLHVFMVGFMKDLYRVSNKEGANPPSSVRAYQEKWRVENLWTRTERLRMRNRIIQLLSPLCCLPIQAGCIGEDDYADDPVGNLEQLWKIIDERHYLLDSKGIDWDVAHEKYSELTVPGTSNDDPLDKLGETLYILKNGHINPSSAKRVSHYNAQYQGYPWNYWEDILCQYYLGSVSRDYYTSAGMEYRISDNNIGYTRYESFSSGVGDGSSDEIPVYLVTCNGLIIDVRDNEGGNLINSSHIAARLTNSKILTGSIQHKTGTGHSDLFQSELIYLEPFNSIRWQKKVVILTNRRCYSATSDFVNLMHSIDNGKIIQVGDQTGGGLGLPFTPELPDGWGIRFSASPHLDKNMQPLEEDILLDIAIDMTEDDQSKRGDTLTEKAFEILSE